MYYFRGIEVDIRSHGTSLSQRKYVGDLLECRGMSKCKPCSTPIAISPTLSKCDGQPLLQGDDYQKILGALQYVTITCPNIAFSVNKLCQFMHAPTNIHWKTLKCLLHYLNGTKSAGLYFPVKLSIALHCYMDSDWGGDTDDQCSTNGYAIFLGSSLTSWLSKKQPMIARPSTESEYKAITNATYELIWLKSLLGELGFDVSSFTHWCDNIGSTNLSSNLIFMLE